MGKDKRDRSEEVQITMTGVTPDELAEFNRFFRERPHLKKGQTCFSWILEAMRAEAAVD